MTAVVGKGTMVVVWDTMMEVGCDRSEDNAVRLDWAQRLCVKVPVEPVGCA